MAFFSHEGLADQYSMPPLDSEHGGLADYEPQPIAPFLRESAMDPVVYRNLAGLEDLQIADSPLPMGAVDFLPSSKAFQQEFPASPLLIGASKAAKVAPASAGFDDELFWGGSSSAEPKACPAWVDPNCSFTVSFSASQVLQKIQQCFRDNKIDFSVDEPKFKISAVCYDCALPSRFQVRVYKKSSSETLVEFQKRSECGLAFRQTFCSVAAFVSSQPRPQRVDLSALPMPPLDDDEIAAVGEVDVRATITNLTETIREELLDQQRQAAAALVEVSSKHAAEVKEEEGMVDLLLTLLHSADEDLARCAAIILANVSVHCKPQAEALLGPMFQAMESPGTLVNMDTKRHISAALAELAACFNGSARPFPQQFTNTLKRFRDASDNTVRQNILRAEEALHSSCALGVAM